MYLSTFCIFPFQQRPALGIGGSGEWGESLNLPDSRANAPRHHLVYQHKQHVSGGRRSPDDLASDLLIGRRRLNRGLSLVDGGCGTCDGGDSGDDSWVSWGRAVRSVEGWSCGGASRQWAGSKKGRNLSLRQALAP